MPDSALDQLLKLRQAQVEREAKLFVQAKEELLQEYSDLKRKFAAVGIPMPGYGAAPKAEPAPPVKRKRNPNKPCPFCNVTGHDGRKHKGQKTKRAFSREEMAALGL